MIRARLLTLALGAALGILVSDTGGARAESAAFTEKIHAYVACINRLSERAYDARERYFSWVGKKGRTGKERIIYGTYTIYETADCKAGVEKANGLEPDDGELEAAASAYVEAVVALEPLLKEADDYYEQENYKDDKMAKGKEMHPRLVAAWGAFASADEKLRAGIDGIQDKQAAEKLAEIERSEGRKEAYLIQAVMMRAKSLMQVQKAGSPQLAKITQALDDYEAVTKEAETFVAANREAKIGSSFIGDAKSFLVTAKQLMRRVRDKVPYSSGDKMMLQSGGGWMVEGSPDRLLRDYNELVDSYNRGANFWPRAVSGEL